MQFRFKNINLGDIMAVVGFHRLEELFRRGAGLDIKKGHAKAIQIL